MSTFTDHDRTLLVGIAQRVARIAALSVGYPCAGSATTTTSYPSQ